MHTFKYAFCDTFAQLQCDLALLNLGAANKLVFTYKEETEVQLKI